MWRNPRCPVRMRVAGGVIFEGRADKPLGVVVDKPYPGHGKFRQNARRFPAVAVNHSTGHIV
ncbi:MAG: hypothetical protein PUK73_02750 [Spirochaetota bacterium]|uniref:hypothetical protein n=1 Tax=Candidatus Avelusimicrobium faecicola TaxID=3416205 RepID=UPI002A60A4D1|nr:hypothetical protein [Spirochaetota bacterium]MDY6128826.1 hypothetical protein [Elusimicrobiaceae bacterium]